MRQATESVPYLRIIHTRRARPSLASHAPKVSRMIQRNVSNSFEVPMRRAIDKARIKIIPSRARSLIRRCFRCIAIVIIGSMVRRGIVERRNFIVIVRRVINTQSLVYKTNASNLAFLAFQMTTMYADFRYPKPIFYLNYHLYI